MSRAPRLRGALWITVIGWTLNTGCTHNHYYGTSVPGCPPVGSTITTQVGSVCDVPSGQVVVSRPPSGTISSNVIPQQSASSSAVTSGARSQVVISQPAYGPPSIGQTSNRFGKWRKLDPEGIPTMKAEGGLDDPIIRQ